MKRCHACQRIYSDDALKFCRIDGAELTSIAVDSQDTLIRLPKVWDRAPDTEALQQSPKVSRLSQLTFSEAIEEYPAWPESGDEIAFSREDAGIRSIFVKTLTSGEERRL